jgi:DNA ligase 1
MMHGSDYAGQDPRGWIVTEKFDGFFARWTGETLLTREGVNYNAPEWFIRDLPLMPLDCELFAGRGMRHRLNGITRWKNKAYWAQLLVDLIVFDAPAVPGGYETRHDFILDHVTECHGILVVPRWTCSGKRMLVEALSVVRIRGGEGLVIRHPSAPYTVGRVPTMLKVKPESIR